MQFVFFFWYILIRELIFFIFYTTILLNNIKQIIYFIFYFNIKFIHYFFTISINGEREKENEKKIDMYMEICCVYLTKVIVARV